MTTEVGFETEVKEKAEETVDQLDQSETAKQEAQELANVEEEEREKGKGKEKEGKGITRYLPTWFKKQKSQSQTSPTKEVPPTEEPVSKGTEGEEEAAPEVNGHAQEVEEKEEEEVKSEKVKEATEAESASNASAETEPAKEEKVKDTREKSPEKTKETAQGEEAKEEDKKKEPEGHVEAEADGEESQTSIFQSPLRLVRKNKMKVVVCHVILLDGTDFTCEVEKRAKGQYLFFKVCEHLNLLEKDYFGLTYKDSHDEKCWLDPTKEIKRQIRSNNWQFSFSVKFYPPDPSQLTEDITRYLLCLQLREDVSSGRLPCSFVTHALLGSYTLQAEFGDHEPDQPHPSDFINQLMFSTNQNKEMEEKILELHKSHRGMTPAQADLQFVENAKKLSMYGVDLHHAKDSEGVDIMLGVCANGLLVYKDRLRINRFAWPKILKISYKRNNFYIKIRPGETEQFESTVGFKLQNHRSAKRLWKVCVENHSFFRLNAPEPPTKARFLTLGSKFRYSGRTQAQTRLASSLIDRPAPNFERTSSKRISRSLDGAPVISITEAGSEIAENGQDSRLELQSDSKVSVPQTEAASADNTSSDTKEPAKTIEVEIEETVVIQEVSRVAKPGLVSVTADSPATPPAEQEPLDQTVKVEEEVAAVEEVKPTEPERASSESESEEEAEYHPNVPASISQTQIPEEKEEEAEEMMKKEEEQQVSAPVVPSLPVEVSQPTEEMCQEDESKKEDTYVEENKDDQEEKESGRETEESTDDPMLTPEEAPDGILLPGETMVTNPTEEQEQPRMNGEASLIEVDPRPQVICCSEPPVVKTEMVTISDTFAAQKTEIATKEVPIVHTETKTITYEAAQLDGSGDGEPGVLMTAQTITSESLCTTTTTHITKTLKGGLSETRIEKRIVITGDCDIDHDQALAQAIKEAKEQHPDMSVTRVVVHKETELAEEED
ncbi:band 4.1-like protein 2 isoform X8 [Girardinichthys multiradiatus]|uniref:band 4.1-like protein 2 isoform X8 n=1 Tax=Girardinichthys multiradiatus TaxID=208333 RepID=UPI001FAE54E8|nr:band 4.1-like protein 2 isoform X8 [Girardinichthys multiradiatus]